MFSNLAAFLTLLPLLAGPQAQEPPAGLTVGILVDESGAPEVLDAAELESAATALLQDKLPGIKVESGLHRLTLWIQPACVDGGRSCGIDVELLRVPRWAGEAGQGYPFGYRPHLVLWRTRAILVAEREQMLPRSRAWLDAQLDAPAAAWSQLPEEQRSCWVSYLQPAGDDADAFELPSTPADVQLEDGTDASAAYRQGFDMGAFQTWIEVRRGPCQAAGEAQQER